MIQTIPTNDTLRQKMKIYFNWSCNMLVSSTPATDKYLRDHLETIREVAIFLLDTIDYEPRTIYRGVIMQSRIDLLHPHENMKYLCFSEDKRIAEIFADPTHLMAWKFWDFPVNHGYLTEYTPASSEILFHYKFLELLPYVEILEMHGIDGSTIQEQKEVTILQPEKPLPITHFKTALSAEI